MTDSKTQISTSEKIYADSLIQVGRDGLMSFEEIFNNLNLVKEVISQSRDFVEAMENPAIDDKVKFEIINEIFSNQINEKIINFLKVLITKKRFCELDKIIQAYSNELDEINNIKRVEVLSAVDLTEEQINLLKEKLQNKLQKNVVISQQIDKGIIGGLVIKIDDDIIDNSLKNRCSQIFLGRSFIDQRLDVGLCEDAAPCRDGIHGFVAFGIFVQAGSVGLQKGRHLVDEGTCAAGANAVHTLLHVSSFKINDLCVFPAQLDGHVGFRGEGLQRLGNGNDFLCKRNIQILRQGQPAGSGDDRIYVYGTQGLHGALQEHGERFLDICKMSFIIGKQNAVFRIQNCNLNGSGTDIDSQTVTFVHNWQLFCFHLTSFLL